MGDVGKIYMGGEVGEADVEKRVVHAVVAVVADQRAHVALRVVILGGIEAVVDQDNAAALQFFGQGVHESVLCRVQFAGVGLR